VERTDSPRIRGTQGTSPRTEKEEKQENRRSIQANRKQSAKHLAGSVKIPDLTDYVKLSSKQRKLWGRGLLDADQLTEAQMRQYAAFEKKLPKTLTDPLSEESPRNKTVDARPSSLSSAKNVKDKKSKVPLDSKEQSPFKPTGKSSPRIGSRGGTPRVAGIPATPIAEWNWPPDSKLELLDRKIRSKTRQIDGLKQQVVGAEDELQLLQQKRDRIATESSPRPRTARQPDLQTKGGNDTSSSDLDRLVDTLNPSRKQ